MASNPLFYDATVEAAVNAAAALLNSGYLNIYTGSQPSLNGSLTGTLLASVPFQAGAFTTATAAGGTVTATANTLVSGTCVASGTGGYFAVLASNGTTVVGTGTVGMSGCDLNFAPSVAFTQGATVSVTSFNITQPQS